jgi:anti-anti-sigma factor
MTPPEDGEHSSTGQERSPLQVRSEVRADSAVLWLGGVADHSTATELTEVLELCLGQGVRHLLLDLADVVVCDEMVPAVVMAVRAQLEPEGGTIELCHVPDELVETLRAAGYLHDLLRPDHGPRS